jgi:hypothetical protein
MKELAIILEVQFCTAATLVSMRKVARTWMIVISKYMGERISYYIGSTV